MQLHDVHQGIHRRKKRKRIGRGIGSGHGKTSTKGHKGHSSRQGFKLSPIFEGGQMPLARRVPKRGFVNGAFKKSFAIVNLADIEAKFEPGAVVDEKALRRQQDHRSRGQDRRRSLPRPRCPCSIEGRKGRGGRMNRSPGRKAGDHCPSSRWMSLASGVAGSSRSEATDSPLSDHSRLSGRAAIRGVCDKGIVRG
jgi:large subunit ribosomal protein L15